MPRAPAGRGTAEGWSRLPRPDLPETIAVKELRNLRSPETQIVMDFYRLWSGDENYRPTNKEKTQASQVIAQHGQAKARALIPVVVKRMREKWPDAKSFGAMLKYLPDAAEILNRRQRQSDTKQQEQMVQHGEEDASADKTKEEAVWKSVWDKLPAEERETIRQSVLRVHVRLKLDSFPKTLERFCLSELAKRSQKSVPLANQ